MEDSELRAKITEKRNARTSNIMSIHEEDTIFSDHKKIRFNALDYDHRRSIFKERSNTSKAIHGDLKKFVLRDSQRIENVKLRLSRIMSHLLFRELLWQKLILDRKELFEKLFSDHSMLKIHSSGCSNYILKHVKKIELADKLSAWHWQCNKEIGSNFYHFLKLYFESAKNHNEIVFLNRYIRLLHAQHANYLGGILKQPISVDEYRLFVDYTIDCIERHVPEFHLKKMNQSESVMRRSREYRTLLKTLRYALEKVALIMIGRLPVPFTDVIQKSHR